MPKPLNTDRLQKFEPSNPKISSRETPSHASSIADQTSRWPSREPIRDGQISIKAPLDVISRFKHICKSDRRTYADMLNILMDLYESKK